ncbi:SGNH/GDSL hydrolase family protein [Microbacterium sp. 18062]|uniref:SGNH/GDSL hydrolase family protein n=1 Tax=Microbacterium sp. 18062 TaxID=2681410 RepID=UPI001359D183|nr:SGNH/GDSL hydrolase family protein [Microbacterium sp. 18062]
MTTDSTPPTDDPAPNGTANHADESPDDTISANRTPYVPNPETHPWRRFVAIGDSFTEGIGDPSPDSPGGNRGWADRVAEVLAASVDDFAYANLAVRGKLIGQIVADQVEPALALQPDLVSICAGGNDVIRPGTDPDETAEQFEDAVIRLSSGGATVLVFTGIDTGFSPVMRGLRGKVAIYNENLRAIAEKYDCIVADQWALKEIQDARFFADDRLHLNTLGHHEVARMVLRALNVPNDLAPMQPEPLPRLSWRAARAGDLVWARTHFVPWVLRRLRHQSSGDDITAKRPEPSPVLSSRRPDADAPAAD